MSLRPRYSLLTLLVLTALVAGGVKWWYGPHQVVERTSPNLEGEYTFRRDLFGNKIIHGPLDARMFHNDGTVYRVSVVYYRHGQQLNWRYDQYYQRNDFAVDTSVFEDPVANSRMRPKEYEEFQQAIAREVQKRAALAPGMHWIEFQGTDH